MMIWHGGGKMSSESLTGAKFDDLQCHWFPAGGSLMCCTSVGGEQSLCLASSRQSQSDFVAFFYASIVAFPSLSGALTQFVYRKCLYRLLWREKNSPSDCSFSSVSLQRFKHTHTHTHKKNTSMTAPPPACHRWWNLRCTSPALSLTDRSWPILSSALWAGPKIALASITRSVKSTVTEPA